MIRRTMLSVLFLMIAIPTAHAAIVIDVNDRAINQVSPGLFTHIWALPDTNITQLSSGIPYSVDIEFETGQYFDLTALPPFGWSAIGLSFVRSLGDNPNFGLSSGTLEFTGISGDFHPSSSIVDLSSVVYGEVDSIASFVNVQLVGPLTTDGFSFSDLHFDFELTGVNDYSVGSVSLFAYTFSEVPIPGTIFLFGVGLVWINRINRNRMLAT